MAGICIEKLPHSCGSKDGLQVFQSESGEYNGFCFKCNTYVPSPYGDKEQGKPQREATPDNSQEQMAEIAALPTRAITERKLEEWALAYFGVKTALSEQDGITPTVAFFPFFKDSEEPVKYLARIVARKDLYWVGPKTSNLDLFGWKQAVATGRKTLYITEGAYDAVALYQALKQKNAGGPWAEQDPAVVSLINGAAGASRELTRHAQRIKANFKDIVFVFDKDEAGKAATKAAMLALPSGKAADLPAKDANDAVMAGKSLALANAVVFKAATPKNTRLVWGQSLHEAGRKQAAWGLSWPWEGMTQLTRGMRLGETYYFGAGVKMGKSELVNTLGAHLIREHKMKIFMAKPEETNAKTYQLLCGKIAGKIFHDPNIEFDYEAYDAASKVVGDNVCMLNLYQHLDWSTLRQDIQSAAADGCKAVFLDPITNLSNGVASGEANTLLQEIAQDFASIAMDHNLLGLIFCHLKSPDGGPSHERGGKVLSHQFAGSRAMMRSCHMMIGLEGNKDPDMDVEERNMRRLVILEDREFGASGTVNLYWDCNTGLFNEVKK